MSVIYEVGRLYRTPFEPSGLVRLEQIEPGHFDGRRMGFVTFVGDHPAGYEDGSPGRYFLDELRPVDDGKT